METLTGAGITSKKDKHHPNDKEGPNVEDTDLIME